MVVFGAIAKALMLVRSVDGRASPAGLFAGIFVAPGLGWPEGVQEEDRDRLWSWDASPSSSSITIEPPAAQPVLPMEPRVGVLIDLDVGGVPVHRCERGKMVAWSRSRL